jgi:glycosyltransferase involved in cell wall biosynthesis
MQVSVVIPVYNAAAYVRVAVESALAQPQTAEVLLAEDGSPDDSLTVCESLIAEYPERVRLLRHPKGENREAGATRNLGIKNAQYDVIAFLDADDKYLPGRFDVALKMLTAEPELDGVYEAVGTLTEANARIAKRDDLRIEDMMTLKTHVPPEDLLHAFISGKNPQGHPHLNGLTLRRRAIDRAGDFHEHIPLHEDTEFIIRLAATCRLKGGRLDEPVAVYRIHAENRFTTPRPQADVYYKRVRLGMTVFRWGCENLDAAGRAMALDYLLRYVKLTPRAEHTPKLPDYLERRWRVLRFVLDHPRFLRERAVRDELLASPRGVMSRIRDLVKR